MNCYEFQDYISSYIEKKLTLSTIKQFEHHLENCSACSDAYKGVVSVIAALRNSDRVTLTERFNSRLQSRLRKLTSRPTDRFSGYFEGGRIFGFEPKYAVASVVATVLIIFFSIGLFPDKKDVSSSKSIPLSTQQVVKEPAGIPAIDMPNQPTSTYVAEESNDLIDDSTDTESDTPKSIPNVNRKIKLVKDRR